MLPNDHIVDTVVTSRPTADSFYSRLNFDQSVEIIIGCTEDKIDEYVSRFFENNESSKLKAKVHAPSSSNLLNL